MRFVIFLIALLTFHAQADIKLSDLDVTEAPVKAEGKLSTSEFNLRHEKLKKHEMLGLATFGMMTATMLTGGSAIGNDLHMYLGFTTAALYFTTAYYSLSAPRPANITDKARMKWHKRLAWIHFPAMVIAPILGYLHKRHAEDGKKLSGMEKQHPTVAGVLYGSFALSTALMVIEF